ncbi:GIN domain-containing protein [Aliirhizobium smilacinae]
MTSTCGPSGSTRQQITLPLAAIDGLAISLPATVRYQPGGEAQAIVSGDQTLLEHVRLENGRLDLDCEPGWPSPRLEVSISGPPITEWKMLGNVDLSLTNIDQPQIRFVIQGSGNITAAGTTESVRMEISGSGAANLKELSSQSTEIEVRGSGDAQITAKATADVSISGSGNVELFGNPMLRRSEIRGSGRIQQFP